MKVFSVNMWGLRWPFGEDDIERFRTLREVLRKEDYDFVLLQEVIALEMNKISSNKLFVKHFLEF